MMTLGVFVREATEALQTLYPQQEARSVALMLTTTLLGTRSYTHVIEPGLPIPEDKAALLDSSLVRLLEGCPIQYVLGETEFCGRNFKVDPSVLIPRPETELLCRAAISHAQNMPKPQGRPLRILDLCTGSGCIAWTLALSVPSAQVTAVDISPEALALAASQQPALPGEDCIPPVFLKADVLDVAHFPCEGPYDLILSNPPYVTISEKAQMRRNVLDYEPGLALFVPDSDPLRFYLAISRLSRSLMAPGGWGITEINETLGRETAALFDGEGLRGAQILSDFNGKDRFVSYFRA